MAYNESSISQELYTSVLNKQYTILKESLAQSGDLGKAKILLTLKK